MMKRKNSAGLIVQTSAFPFNYISYLYMAFKKLQSLHCFCPEHLLLNKIKFISTQRQHYATRINMYVEMYIKKVIFLSDLLK